MSVKGIIARFLPLLDVITCLLGMFIILLAVAKMHASPTTNTEKIRSLFLYAKPDGTVEKIDPNTGTLTPFDNETDKDIAAYFSADSQNKPSKLLFLCTGQDEDDGPWTGKRIENLVESKWKLQEHNIKYYRLINAPFIRNPQTNLQTGEQK
ncbi:MAG: hypothetical protein LBT46_10205 [Planctomycetaceae bacterium]|jgi:hypothetical protein|nr:hypothetical protein [Planctomycetaceae bacterium]